MESPWPSVVAILLYTLTVVEGVLIQEGQEVVNFTCADDGRINVTMMCVGKYSNVISSSYVVIRWYDSTDPSNKVLIMTIDNATQVSLGPDIDNTTVVDRLSTDRLDGSILLSLKVKEDVKTLRYKVFTCDVQALSDTPSVYNRPVFAYSSCCDCEPNQTCPPSTPDAGGPGVIAGVLCLILSIVCLTMLFLAVFVPYLKGSSFIGLVQAHGTCCLVLTLCVLVIGAILSFAGFIVACIYLSKLAVDTSCEKFQDLIIAATVCSVVGLVCAVYVLVFVGYQKPGVNGWWLSNKSREFTVDATNSRPKSTGNVSKKDVELCVNKGNNHSSPRRRKNSVEPKEGENGVPQPVRGTPRQLPPMPAYERRQPPPMPPVDTTSSPVKKVRKKKKKTHTPEEL